jgi:fumarate reductase flavoprotein subunit
VNAPEAQVVPDTGRFDLTVDVLVAGAGGCGLVAGLAAARAGAETLVLEKLVRPLSNTARSGGMFPAAGTELQRAAGVREDPEDFAADILTKNAGACDRDRVSHLTRTARDVVHWLIDEVGIVLKFVGDFKYPGHSNYRMHAPPSRTGAQLSHELRAALDDQKSADLALGSTVVGLIVDPAGAVRGVVARDAARDTRIRADSVVLATNGFAGNPALVSEFCPEIANALYFGGEGSQGEAILWGRELRARLDWMDAYQGHASVASPHGILITYAVVARGGFHVNLNGERFGNEMRGYSEFALEVLRQPEGMAWLVYDEAIHRYAQGFEDYRDASEHGACRHGETLEEVAEGCGLPASALAETARSFEAALHDEQRDPFGRARGEAQRLRPPYRAVRVTGALFHTQGGLAVDDHARVLRGDGSVIEGLYAGGGAAAGISGCGANGYLSGNGLLTALCYGYLAGQHASRRTG